MKSNRIKYIIIMVIILPLSCIQIEQPSTIPLIIYKSHNSGFCEDEIGNLNKCIDLTFTLEDGDGNIGLMDKDTIEPFTGIYRHNFYYNVYVLENGSFIPYEDLVTNFFDIPYIEPQGQNKILIADITIQFRFYAQNFQYDTLMIEFFIFDRAQNQSNIELSDTISFEQVGFSGV